MRKCSATTSYLGFFPMGDARRAYAAPCRRRRARHRICRSVVLTGGAVGSVRWIVESRFIIWVRDVVEFSKMHGLVDVRNHTKRLIRVVRQPAKLLNLQKRLSRIVAA